MKSRIPKESKQTVSLTGTLLAASPRLGDQRFAHSVVLVLHHGAQGTLGIVLNRPMIFDESSPLSALQEKLGKGRRLFQGGPVGGLVVAIVPARRSEDAALVGGQVVLLQQDEQLRHLLQQVPDELMIFLGHAVWAEGQLEREIAAGAWYVIPAYADLLGMAGGIMWIEAIRRAGRQFYQEVLGIKRFPEDISQN